MGLTAIIFAQGSPEKGTKDGVNVVRSARRNLLPLKTRIELIDLEGKGRIFEKNNPHEIARSVQDEAPAPIA